jgi:hypothetical protein
MAFWKNLLISFTSVKFKQRKADPCLYFAWTLLGLVLIDDCLIIGQTSAKQKAKKLMTDCFDWCNIIGNMDEYIGCKLKCHQIEG